jgi:hypothetical protein
MIRNLTLCCFAILLATSLTAATAESQEKEQAKPALPPVRMIPGITAADSTPHACVDCHINYPEMKLDARFSTQMARWNERVEPGLLAKARASAPAGMILKGKHPRTTGAFNNIPAQCLVCHGKDSRRAPPFARMLHMIHLTGGDENHFLTIYQGECTHCHKLDPSTGRWSIPSAAEK